MPEILVSHSLEKEHREIVFSTLSDAGNLVFLPDVPSEQRSEAIKRAEVLLSWNPAKEFSGGELGLLGNARLLQLITAGAEHLPFQSLPTGMLIACNPGAYAAPMAEHVLGMILSLAKRLCLNNARLKRGEFDQATKTRIIRGLTCGVIGFGGIGQAAARVLQAVGLRIFAVNTSGRTTEPVDFIGTLDDLGNVLKNSDVLLLAIPLNIRTRGLIGRHELALMKSDAILVNVARGAIIDEQALYEHLVQNPEFNAAIDTWWIEPSMGGEFKVNYPFFNLPNFIGSPHNSAIAPGVMDGAVRASAENVLRFISGEKVRGEVNRNDYI